MPYIAPEWRQLVDKEGPKLKPGHLAYALSRDLETYRRANGDSYATFNAILGALASAKREFERVVVDPYEARKAVENGPVHTSCTDGTC